MSKLCISDSRLANKRFRKSEEVILRVYCENGSYISANSLAKKAGMARSTFYTHHHAVREIIPDYEKYILRKYRRIIRKMLTNKRIKASTLFDRTFIFILMNKKIFKIFLKFDDRYVITEIINELKDMVIKEAKLTRNKEKIFQIFVSEVEVIIKNWCKEGFDFKEVDKCVSETVYLMNTSRIRLGVLE